MPQQQIERAKIILLVIAGKQDIDIAAVSEAAVRREWRAFGLKPIVCKPSKLSRDPKRTTLDRCRSYLVATLKNL
ncbi:MAG: hypothetical protein WCE73_24645 [Candidatus Angelobacter sp.]